MVSIRTALGLGLAMALAAALLAVGLHGETALATGDVETAPEALPASTYWRISREVPPAADAGLGEWIRFVEAREAVVRCDVGDTAVWGQVYRTTWLDDPFVYRQGLSDGRVVASMPVLKGGVAVGFTNALPERIERVRHEPEPGSTAVFISTLVVRVLCSK